MKSFIAAIITGFVICSLSSACLAADLLSAGAVDPAAAATISQETIIITGTGSGIGVMEIMARAFQEKHPAVTVQLPPSIGSSGAIKAVQAGKIDIGLSARPLKPEERSGEIFEKPYGRTAFIFGVQDSNPVPGFTLAEIEEIYAGTRRSWPDGTPIRLTLRPLSDAYSLYLASINPGLQAASAKAHAIPDVFVGNTDQEAARQIEQTPGSFGTTSGAVVAAEKRKIKALAVDGTAPTLANIASGNYPYTMTMSFVYQRDKYRGASKDFIDFVFSRDGQMILAANGFVPLSSETREER
ncbi:MAG: substrate-binding domain-containing protein [Desulfocapsaceae bacterium]|nr:substrate-binding domain-containing protein [Desulfocapsaceae bacterium]